MNLNKISIITLTYRNWHLLEKAIASVVSQVIDTKYQVEYLIVDDGTDDFDAEYIDTLLRNSGLNYRIIVNVQNVGTVASFNNAIHQSKGDIIIPLSADDEFYDSYVVNDIANEFVTTNAYIITGRRVPIVDGIEGDPLPSEASLAYFNNPKALLKRILVRGNLISGSVMYYHRNVFKEFGFFDTRFRLIEDYPYVIRVLSKGVRLHFLNRNLIKYGLSGVSTGNPSKAFSSDMKLLYEDILKNNEVDLFEKRYIRYHRMMTIKQKLIKSILYPDQMLVFLWRFIR